MKSFTIHSALAFATGPILESLRPQIQQSVQVRPESAKERKNRLARERRAAKKLMERMTDFLDTQPKHKNPPQPKHRDGCIQLG